VANAQKRCEKCEEQPATVHLTEMSNQHVVQERHLCDVCAAKEGVIGKINVSLVSELLGTLKDKQKAGGSPAEVELKCADCGLNYAEFKAKARFGCARDYDVFRKHVVTLLDKIHGATQHTGKKPRGLQAVQVPPAAGKLPAAPQAAAPAKGAAAKAKPKPPAESGLAELEKELERQILAEDYEKAAKLRDRIRELKAKKEPG